MVGDGDLTQLLSETSYTVATDPVGPVSLQEDGIWTRTCTEHGQWEDKKASIPLEAKETGLGQKPSLTEPLKEATLQMSSHWTSRLHNQEEIGLLLKPSSMAYFHHGSPQQIHRVDIRYSNALKHNLQGNKHLEILLEVKSMVMPKTKMEIVLRTHAPNTSMAATNPATKWRLQQ